MSPEPYPTEYAPNTPYRRVTPAVGWLIAVNVGVYFLQLVTFFGADSVTEWFALSPLTFPQHWWAVGTYMFVHAGLIHVATNMIMLWMFGPRVEHAFGTRSFTYFYLWCGLGGAVFHLLFTHEGAVVGASGAVVGVVLAYALRWADEEVYLLGVMPMKARWLAIWTIAINVGMALANMTGYTNSTTAWMAHVGGLAFAWLYLHAPTVSSLDRIRRHVAAVPDEPEPRPIPKASRQKRHEEPPPTADEAVARSNALVKRRPASIVSMLTSQPHPPADDVNALLDKISREGIQSLTPAERQLLDDVSRRLRSS